MIIIDIMLLIMIFIVIMIMLEIISIIMTLIGAQSSYILRTSQYFSTCTVTILHKFFKNGIDVKACLKFISPKVLLASFAFCLQPQLAAHVNLIKVSQYNQLALKFLRFAKMYVLFQIGTYSRIEFFSVQFNRCIVLTCFVHSSVRREKTNKPKPEDSHMTHIEHVGILNRCQGCC